MPAKKKTSESKASVKETPEKKTTTRSRKSSAEEKVEAAPKAKKTATEKATAETTKASTASKAAKAVGKSKETATKKATSAEKTASTTKTTAKKTSTTTKASKPKATETTEKAKTTSRKTAGASKASTTRRATSRKKVAEAAPEVEPRIVEEALVESVSPTDVREHYVERHHVAPATGYERDLPPEYGDTKIVLLVRDPEWVFAYWEVNDETRERYGIPRSGHNRRMVLRVYNVTGRNWPTEGAQYFFDIDISPYANNWYIKVPETDAEWVAELGIFDEQGEYVPVVASNVVRTPRDTMSPDTDAEWMVIEETFRKIYESSGGLRIRDGWRGSEELWRHLQKQIYPSLAGAEQFGGSGVVAGSGGVAAGGKAAKNQEGFWLRAEAELVLYGATEPTATVTVNGEPVKLTPDGSFSLRFALPDGEQKLVIRAVSADERHERMITKIVKKLTK